MSHVLEVLSANQSQQELVEAGLSRIYQHLQKDSIGILSAVTPNKNNAENDKAHHEMIKHLRGMNYGPIEAQGRSQWGPERSLIVPGITPGHLSQVGNAFKQQAVIHVPPGGEEANLHWLDTSDKPGTVEKIGHAHFNKPNINGITALKGLGFRPKDDRAPSRSFTFSKENREINQVIIESLSYPPTGQLNPLPRVYS